MQARAATHTAIPLVAGPPHEDMAEIEASTIREVLLVVRALKENFDGMRAEIHTLITTQNGRLSKVETDQSEIKTSLALAVDRIAFLQKVAGLLGGLLAAQIIALVTWKLTGH